MAADELTFTTAGREVPPPKLVDVVIDGHTYQARKPKEAVLALLLAATRRGAGLDDKAYACLRFLATVFTPESYADLEGRLEDADDALELVDLVNVMEALVGHWADEAGGKNTPPNTAGNRTPRRAVTPR